MSLFQYHDGLSAVVGQRHSIFWTGEVVYTHLQAHAMRCHETLIDVIAYCFVISYSNQSNGQISLQSDMLLTPKEVWAYIISQLLSFISKVTMCWVDLGNTKEVSVIIACHCLNYGRDMGWMPWGIYWEHHMKRLLWNVLIFEFKSVWYCVSRTCCQVERIT